MKPPDLAAPAAAPAFQHRIVHVHIPKTAGTAIRSSVEARSGAQWRAAPHVTERNADRLATRNFNFYSGHIGFNTAQRIGGTLITVIRDPVDRFVSTYYFLRQLYETGLDRSTKSELASKYSLDAFLSISDEMQLIAEFHNRSAWQIGWGYSPADRRLARAEGVDDDKLLALAIENLGQFAVVGVQDRMDRFAADINTRFGLDLAIKPRNITANRPKLRDIPTRTIRAIYDWTYLDFELYRTAAAAVR
jgi:hypothetical protein